jgi:hypothetical protein
MSFAGEGEPKVRQAILGHPGAIPKVICFDVSLYGMLFGAELRTIMFSSTDLQIQSLNIDNCFSDRHGVIMAIGLIPHHHTHHTNRFSSLCSFPPK